MKYRGLIVDDVHSAPSDSAIANLESQLKRQIPDDYRAFLSACNGGYVDYEIEIAFEDGSSEPMSFSGYYRLVLDGQWETNPYELTNARQMERFPSEGVLPIARDGGGSQLYLDLRDGYRVVAFVHGLPAWTGRRQQDSLVELAPSFDAYWDKLKITDSYVQDFIENYDPKYGNPDAAAEWLDTGSPNWRGRFSGLWQKHVLEAHKNQTG